MATLRRSRRRWLLVALGLVVVIAAIGGIKGCQIGKLIGFGKSQKAAGPPPEAVGTAQARAVVWKPTLTAVGTVSGRESVRVATEAAGRVEQIKFESGQTIKAGQVLIQLDDDLEQAQLESAIAKRDRALLGNKRTRELVQKGAVPVEQLDDSETLVATTEAEVRQIKAQIDYKIVRAPFSGKVGIRSVNLGQWVQVGTAVATIDSTGDMYVDFPLPQEQLPLIRTGMPVKIDVRGRELATGKLAAIDPAIDRTTRMLSLRADVGDEQSGPLRPGMFVNVTLELPEERSVVIVPVTAVVHAPYGDSVFVVVGEDGKRIAEQRFVRTGKTRGDFVEIAKGLRAGDEVVTAGAFKLRNGAPVIVDNRVKTEPSLHPQPENR
jgi:membrane fusion protein (multidrug efflux system)